MKRYGLPRLRNCIIICFITAAGWLAAACASRNPNPNPAYTLSPTSNIHIQLDVQQPNAQTVYPTFTIAPTQTHFVLPDPSLSGPVSIGWSVQGRKILVYRFGTGVIERLIVAGIHGGAEWNTTSLANQLVDHIRSNPKIIPENISLYILPVLNPDGAARPDDDTGRTNANNVDLNRNWDANWKSDWNRKGCWNLLPTTGGKRAMSEPETIALSNFINLHHFDAIISYHSAGLGIFAGGNPSTKESISLAEAVSAVPPYPYPPIDTGCVYTGAFVDWAANQGIAALDVELANHTNTDFKINLKVLSAFLSWSK